MGNFFVYAKRRCSYENCKDPTLLFVPQEIERIACGSLVCPETRREEVKIPCRFISCQTRSTPYLIIFFHGNSEDIGPSLSQLLFAFSERFEMNAMCPEYPSYGIYKKKDDSLTMEEAVLSDARQVLKYCKNHLKIGYDDIILVGRSLGTGVTVRMATEFRVRGCILLSPFTSIRDAAKSIVGGLLAKFAPDAFRSIDYIDQIKCPILIIHGKKDKLLPYQMAVDLYDRAPKKKMVKLNDDMTHNDFRLESDIFAPMQNFMEKELDLGPYLFSKIRLLRELFEQKSSLEASETNFDYEELSNK